MRRRDAQLLDDWPSIITLLNFSRWGHRQRRDLLFLHTQAGLGLFRLLYRTVLWLFPTSLVLARWDGKTTRRSSHRHDTKFLGHSDRSLFTLDYCAIQSLRGCRRINILGYLYRVAWFLSDGLILRGSRWLLRFTTSLVFTLRARLLTAFLY